MEQFNQNGMAQFFEIILFSTFLWMIIFLITCAKARKRKADSNSSNIGKQQRIERLKPITPSNFNNTNNTTKTAKTETTRDIGSALSASGTPQLQNDVKADTSKDQKKTSKQNTSKNKATKKSRREKEEKKESNLKKFFHKLGGGGSSEKKENKSFEEAYPDAPTNNNNNNGDENEKLPLSSRKTRQRKMSGDNLKTAEDNEHANIPGEEEPKIVDPVKVVQMGNIDIITQQEKDKRIREIEQMPSGNYCEEGTQRSNSIKKEGMHVKIVESNCRLYETNPEPQTKSLRESMRKRKKIKHQLRPRSKSSEGTK